MYCMSGYKNKSEAFTAVIPVISLYNSVACHETHTHTHSYSSTCIYKYTFSHADYIFITNAEGK